MAPGRALLPALQNIPRALAFSTSSASGQNATTQENIDRIKAIADSVAKNVEEGVAELKRIYGESMSVEKWKVDYYRHKDHKFCVPALSLICSSEQDLGIPVVASRHIAFFASMFKTLSPDVFAQYAATLTLVRGMDLGMLLAITRSMHTKEGDELFDRLAVSIRRTSNRELASMIQHVGAVDVGTSPLDWKFPWEQLSASDDISVVKTLPYQPWEIAPIFAQAREVYSEREWLLLSSSTMLENLWAGFYATGDKGYLYRILDAALAWNEFANMPESAKYIISVASPLPEELDPEGPNALGSTEGYLRALRAHAGRMAMWTLLHHSRSHPKVVEALLDKCGDLTQWIVEPRVRDQDAIAFSGIISNAEAEKRISIWPMLLHIISRGRLDAPFESE